jgi:LIVCS family branched-chain amino acid:cation transporter
MLPLEDSFMNNKQNSGVLAAGLALFSMFFGAGDLIWPLILGGASGDKNFFAMLGLLITGVSLPLLGLIAMMLFQGDYHSFFGRIGKWPALAVIFIVQIILGPVGSIPRLMTLSYATLTPYMPEISLAVFSVAASLVVLAFTIKPRKVVQLLGLVLTPMLLLSLGAILFLGLISHPSPEPIAMKHPEAFVQGIKVGYNTLDLIASFIFAPLVLSHFVMEGESFSTPAGKRALFGKMVKASLLAAGLLCCMYIGLTYVASYYVPLLDAGTKPEEYLSAISRHLLGPYGACISCLAVAMACLTTAIPLTCIFADYMKKDLMQGRGGHVMPLIATLAISALLANLGFMGIANMLSPLLQVLCPGLIVLSLLNICHKLYETRVPTVPVFATFALSTLGYMTL